MFLAVPARRRSVYDADIFLTKGASVPIFQGYCAFLWF